MWTTVTGNIIRLRASGPTAAATRCIKQHDAVPPENPSKTLSVRPTPLDMDALNRLAIICKKHSLHEASFRIYTLDKFLPPHLKHARRKETRLVSAGFSSVSTPPHSILAVS
mmetsp:Transcript_1299/g.1963  ORF Transcript_1299/g.1963 Transcript_1299/m.1963 type:complete len:112 (-) Transcript_1299:427-762(-)